MELINEEQLKEWSGYKRRSDLQGFLNKNKIEYHLGCGNRICTTMSALEKSLSLFDNRKSPSRYQM